MPGKMNRSGWFYDFFYKERFLIGASLARIGFALVMLYYYLIHYHQRYFLWTKEGMLGDQLSGFKWSLYALSTSTLYFDIIYHLSILIALFTLIGYKTRTVSVLFYVTTFSILNLNTFIADGGDDLLADILFFLMFANTSAHFSVDALDRRLLRRQPEGAWLPPVSALFHNMSILACIIQLCILYFTAGFYQVMGELWNSGVAVYYIAQVDMFSAPFQQKLILHNDVLIVLFTYASIIIKLGFPFMLFNRGTKIIAVIGMILLHLGILAGMGLVSFSLIMIIANLLVIGDEGYGKLLRTFAHLRHIASQTWRNGWAWISQKPLMQRLRHVNK
ncbi:hypothetical protein [Laceyella putida]|uniref:HTTM-like domain-containing protein n=1 Tax=Laceyella putida TaxID=110101 RepID=A0ABW2RG46_9BACL